jgi:hypothetical protein
VSDAGQQGPPGVGAPAGGMSTRLAPPPATAAEPAAAPVAVATACRTCVLTPLPSLPPGCDSHPPPHHHHHHHAPSPATQWTCCSLTATRPPSSPLPSITPPPHTHTHPRVQVLVLSPTRELATQTEKLVLALGDFLNIQAHACIGGHSVGAWQAAGGAGGRQQVAAARRAAVARRTACSSS